jgi:F0F1-type ATP synthase assembly protein I
LLSSMLLALTPISGSARAQCEWRARVPNDPRQARRPLATSVVAFVATLIVLCLVWVEWPAGGRVGDLADPLLRTAVVLFLFLLSAGYLLQVLIRCRIRPLAPVLIWLALSWLGPLLGDVVRYNLLEDQRGSILQSISACSPLGALIQIWSPSGDARGTPISTTLGIAVQVLPAIAFFLLDARTRRTRTKKAS